MNKEINKIIANLEGCVGILDYMLTPIESNLLVSYIKELQKENEQLKDNWNKLKEYLNYKSERAVGEDEYVYDEIYNEMQELKQGSDDNGQ